MVTGDVVSSNDNVGMVWMAFVPQETNTRAQNTARTQVKIFILDFMCLELWQVSLVLGE
jgi:hypothetical protein